MHMEFWKGLFKAKVWQGSLGSALSTEKSLSWYWGFWSLVQALSVSGLWAFGRSGSLGLLSTWTGLFVGPGRCQAHQGLRPCMHGNHFGKQGFTLGHVLPWAPASGTL